MFINIEKNKERYLLYNDYQLPFYGIGGGREEIINLFCPYEQLYSSNCYNE